MENEGSETLDKGLVGLRKCQGGDEIPKEVNSVLMCNLDCKYASDFHSCLSEVKHVELDEDLGNGKVGESVPVDEGDLVFSVNAVQIGKVEEVVGKNEDAWHLGDLEFNVGGVQIEKVEAIEKNNDACYLGDLIVNMDDPVQLNMVEELKGKDDVMWHLHELVQNKEGEVRDKKSDDFLHDQEPGSLPKMEVSGNDINLFVEVFGPLDRFSEGYNCPTDKNEHISEDGDSSNECLSKEKGAPSSCLETASVKNELEGTVVGKLEYRFDIGDLVWARTRSLLWWPGIISARSNAVGDKIKVEKDGTFHVKYYGNGYFVWCNDSEMKPFAEYFDQMSGQNNSRNFSGSVEKALIEYGQRIKLKMTCRCFLKESQRHAVQLLLEKKHENNVLLLSKFEPASFSANIRQLARSALVPGKIDLIAIKNSLSAFYDSTGHLQLPLQQLRLDSQNAQDGLKPEVMDESNNIISGRRSKSLMKSVDDEHHVLRTGKRNHVDDATTQVVDDKASLSGKCLETRERKKSKYLSYPYVDVNKGLNAKSTMEEQSEDHSSVTTKSTPQGRSGGKTSLKGGLRKLSKECGAVGGAANINASPAELLAELRNTARDCFYIHGSKLSDSLKRFCRGFRKFAFLDAGEVCKVVGSQQEPNGKKCLFQKSSEAVVSTEGTKAVKASKKQKIKHATVDNQTSEANSPQAKHEKSSRAKKKKEQVASEGLQSTAGEVVTEGFKVARAPKKKRVNHAHLKETVNDGVDNPLSEANDQQARETGKCKRPRKTKESVKSDNRQPTEAEVPSGGVRVAEVSAKPSVDHVSLKETADKAIDNRILEENGPQTKGNGKRRAAKKKNEGVKLSGVLSAEAVAEAVATEGVEVVKASDEQIIDNVPLNQTVGNSVKNHNAEANGSQLKGNVKHKARKNKKEQIVLAGLQFRNISAVARTENNLNSSCVIDFQKLCPDLTKSITAHEKQEGLNHVLPQIDMADQLPDLNGSQPSDMVEQISFGVPSVSPGNLLPGARREELISPRTSIVNQTPFTVSNLNLSMINLQILPQTNSGASSTNQNLNADFVAGGMEPGAPLNRTVSFSQLSLPVGLSPSAGNSERKERKRKPKAQPAASAILDLNGNVLDGNASGKTMGEVNPTSLESVRSQKRMRSNVEDPGGSLTLVFAPGSSLPCKETLVSKFSRYGLLKESEIQFVEESSSVQIGYARTSDARFAIRSMEKSKPFGEELSSFKLNDVVCPPPPPMIKLKNNKQRTPRATDIGRMRQNSRAGDIAGMRQKVEMMNMTLEKDGSKLAPEIRAKLQQEINVFLDKINSMDMDIDAI